MTSHVKFMRLTRVGPLNLAAIGAVLMFIGSATFANNAAGSTTSADDTAQAAPNQEQSVGELVELHPVVVTAQRRAQSLDKVPISVAALTQKTLTNLGIQTFADMVGHVPGVTFAPVSGIQGSQDVAIRGIFSGGNSPTTEIYIDDTPISVRVMNNAGPQESPFPDIFDLERVEVLRGPQGTLFGSSAMGGAIRYITPQPNLHSAGGYAKMDIEHTDNGGPDYDVGVAYGAPIVPGVAGFRVSAWTRSESGWIDRVNPFTGLVNTPDANSSRAVVVRPAFTVVPIDGLSITAALFLEDHHSDNPPTYWVTELPRAVSSPASGQIPEPATDDLRVSSLTIKYDFARVSFQSNTSYVYRSYNDRDDFTQDIEDDYAGVPFIPGLESFVSPFEDFEHTHAWQQEFRFASPSSNSRLTWVAGAYYRNALTFDSQSIPPDLGPITEAIAGETSLQYTGIPDYYLNGVALNSYTNFRTVDVSEAGYADFTIGIIAGLKGNLGVRVEHSIVKDQNQIVAGPLDGVTYSQVMLPDQIANPITPRFGLTYQFNDSNMAYVTVAKGYRSGGGNSPDAVGNPLCNPSLNQLGLTAVPSSFVSDSLWSYEVGTKDSMFDRRLAIQASAYDIVWNKIQTAIGLPSCSEGFTANEGSATSRGVDLQIQALVGEHLNLQFTAGYNDAYYMTTEQGAPTNGVRALIVAQGEKLPNVVPWSFDVNGTYSWSIDHLWSGVNPYVRVDYRQQGNVVNLDPSLANYDPAVGSFQGQGYGVLNIRIGAVKNGLDLSAYVLNATNADPLLGYGHNSPGDPLFFATKIRPLTTGLTAMYSF